MIVLEINKIFEEVIGLHLFSGSKYHRCITVTVPVLMLGSMLLSAFWALLIFVWNFKDNIQLALSSVPPFLGYLLLAIVHGHFLINRAYFNLLFEDMQSIVNKSTFSFVELIDH